jgi:hypothetical protein
MLLIAVITMLVCAVTAGLVLTNVAGYRRLDEARAQVRRWAEQLHGQTTDAGVYIRHPGNRLPEDDPWGTPLVVSYSQGGFAETLTVRSAGPDRALHTQDDIVEQRSVLNLKGIGMGVKNHVEEFAEKSARGVVRGTAEGIKATIVESLAGKNHPPRKAE